MRSTSPQRISTGAAVEPLASVRVVPSGKVLSCPEFLRSIEPNDTILQPLGANCAAAGVAGTTRAANRLEARNNRYMQVLGLSDGLAVKLVEEYHATSARTSPARKSEPAT